MIRSDHLFHYKTPGGHILNIGVPQDLPVGSRLVAEASYLDLTPHDAYMRPKGIPPTMLSLLRLNGDVLAIATCSEQSLCDSHVVIDFLERHGIETREHSFELLLHDVRDGMRPGDLFLFGPPGIAAPALFDAGADIVAAQSAAADEAFANADFSGRIVAGYSGWEHEGNTYLSCKVFLETDAEASTAMRFGVHFVPNTICVRQVDFELPTEPRCTLEP